jgi:uncharacterized protein YlxW (UPF0749 family)
VAFSILRSLGFDLLGDVSRLNKSYLHDLGVPSHHCYRVLSQLLVEFISFWYQSFGSKITLTILYFHSISCSLLYKKKKKKKNKKKNTKKKTQKKNTKKKTQKKRKKVHDSSKKISSFQKISSF